VRESELGRRTSSRRGTRDRRGRIGPPECVRFIFRRDRAERTTLLRKRDTWPTPSRTRPSADPRA
jgi:hypothetical protein